MGLGLGLGLGLGFGFGFGFGLGIGSGLALGPGLDHRTEVEEPVCEWQGAEAEEDLDRDQRGGDLLCELPQAGRPQGGAARLVAMYWLLQKQW